MASVLSYVALVNVEEMWIESHNGEFYGEAIFDLAAAQATDPVRRAEMSTLAELERQTRKLTAPVITRRGLDPGDVSEDAQKTAIAVAGKTWPEFFDWLERVTDHYLTACYRPLAAQCSDEDERRVAELLVVHEEALASYGRRASGREEGEPLEAVYTCPHMTGVVRSAD